MDLPKCEKPVDLQPHLSTWVQLRGKYGNGLPAEHLIAMFQNILPESVKDDIKKYAKQNHCEWDLDKQVAYVYGEMGTLLDEKLSRWNLTKLQQQLKVKPNNSTGINAITPVEGSDGAPPPPPVPDIATFPANLGRMMERTINAAMALGQRGRESQRMKPPSRSGSADSQRSGRRVPNPRFKGCWCCGKEGHSRANCGKVPKDYGGKVPKKRHR